jgi:hypothetical protein
MTIRKLETMSDWLSVSTDMKISELMHYLITLKSQLENMAEDYTKRIEVELKKIEKEEEKEGFYEWSEEDYYRYKETFPHIFLNSFHVTAYSFLETEIELIAKRVGKKQKQVFDVSEMRGSGNLESAIFYIKKLTGVNAKDKTFASWIGLKEGQRLRNIIVHSNGELTENKDIQLAKKHKVLLMESRIELPSVRATHIKKLSITYEYCVSFLDTIGAFFAKLYEQMKDGDFL